MTTLVLIPTQAEFESFIEAISLTYRANDLQVGLLSLVEFDGLPLAVGLGGLGKVEFAVHAQHLLDQRGWSCFICAGASGALAPTVSHLDVVISTETVEHDIRKVSRPMIPRYPTDACVLSTCRTVLSAAGFNFDVHFGPIASGNEDIVSETRRTEVATRTQALAVAWEGAGAGAACQLSTVPFVEIRGVADSADANGPIDFQRNLRAVMFNVAAVSVVVAKAL